MRIRSFVAPTVQEATARVRRELGPEAVLLSTRRVRRPGLAGWIRPPLVEVTAALEDPGESRENLQVSRELAQLRESIGQVSALLSRGNYPEGLRPVYEALLAQEVEEELARRLSERVLNGAPRDLDPGTARVQAVRELTLVLGSPQPVALNGVRPHVVALVGPTGVGKTTTLAKLAARFALLEHRQVAMITADTYRIAAVEQLKTYGEIIGVPVEVVFSPAELKEAVARHKSADLVLLDTAGRNPHNAMQMAELKGYLEAAGSCEVHLVLSLTTRPREALRVVELYHAAGFHRLLFTKADEAEAWGLVPNLVERTGVPVSYLTTGQKVPDDLEVADPNRIAAFLLGGGGNG